MGELQAALGIAGCAAVGNSLGCYLCMRRALADPTSFARLAVIHPAAVPELRMTALHVGIRVPPAATPASPSPWRRR